MENPSGPGALKVFNDAIMAEISSDEQGVFRELICASDNHGRERFSSQAREVGQGGGESNFSEKSINRLEGVLPIYLLGFLAYKYEVAGGNGGISL